MNDRRTAAAGISMYTASKGWVARIQLLSFWFVTRFGARLLPGRTDRWEPPCSEADWAELVRQWEAALGPLTGMAAYQRRQSNRSGLTLVATRDGLPAAVLKLRDDPAALAVEQRALAAVAQARPRRFRSPRPLGSGSVGRLSWTAQECVFRRPHRAVFDVPDDLFDEVTSTLETIAAALGSLDPGYAPASLRASHGDLTPWNLRRDERGEVWLFDWEDAGLAPAGSDRTYFWLTSAAVTGRRPPPDLPPAAVAHWRAEVQRRVAAGPEDIELGRTLLGLLDDADRSADD